MVGVDWRSQLQVVERHVGSQFDFRHDEV